VRKYPSFSTRNSGFFSRQKRKISARLPSFRGQASRQGYVDKDVYGRGQLHARGPGGCGPLATLKMLFRRGRTRVVLGLFLLWIGYLFLWSSKLLRCT
jgi:mannan polymerase II complex MNN10 subunit